MFKSSLLQSISLSRRPWLIAGGGALAAAVALAAGLASAQSGAEVSIQHHMFMPATITVPVGTTVTWTNEDGAPHTVTSDGKGLFSSGWKLKGAHYAFAFTKAGTYPYHCSIHKGMHGTVVVTGG
jgi:plastocyanin